MPETLKERYILTETVRKGAQATVTRAFDGETGSIVAIKRVPFGPDDARAQEAFQREASILQKISHENIITLIDIDRDNDGNWFLVLEWVEDNLEDVIRRDGPTPWSIFWDRLGEPLLDAICLAQQKGIAHRDIKPKNILVTAAGVPKLADYGIGKLIENGGAWSIVSGFTFRFDHTPGYTPAQPDDEKYVYSRDCFSFAAIVISCVAGRVINNNDDISTILQESNLPFFILPIIEKCLSSEPSERPPMASVLREQISRAMSAAESDGLGITKIHVSLSPGAAGHLANCLGVESELAIESFVAEELSDVCSIQLAAENEAEQSRRITLVGEAWTFEGIIAGRSAASIYITRSKEVGSGLAATLRDEGLNRKVEILFTRPKDETRSAQDLALLLVDAEAAKREKDQERHAKTTQRILKIWRGFLRDRVDVEARRGSGLKYIDRTISGDRVIFTTEIAVGEEIVGQERLVQSSSGRVGGRVALVSFNQLVMDVNFGNAQTLPRRGELIINTIAAQKALSHQTQALDSVIYDRAVSDRLKPIILEPKSALPVQPITGIVPTDDELDDEKKSVLSRALGVQDILAIEGPPGTGKTKLIAEIVVQWLRINPGHRVLLSSQTHIALDNVLERVAAMDSNVDLIRIGRPDEPRISEASQKLLLEKRIESWITKAQQDSEMAMTRWADSNGVDQTAVKIGMSVERLIQLLRRQETVRSRIDEMLSRRQSVDAGISDEPSSTEETQEETTQIDSEIGGLRAELKEIIAKERAVKDAMRAMGGYACELADSKDHSELTDWALHFLSSDPKIEACRARLMMLEDWHLRVGRSSDFNAAVLSSAQVIAGTCIGVAGVKGMAEVAYDLCIIDEASKATPTETLVPMVRSQKWILVGDPNQLPPFFEEIGDDLLAQFDDREIKATLLDRMLDKAEGLPNECRAELRNQYRMIKPIGNLISHCFYDGRLISPIISHGLKLATVFPAPVTWFSTHARKDRIEKKSGQTYFNSGEVREIRLLLQRLQFIAKAQKQKITVAVIAGYTAQVQNLRVMVSQGVAEWPDLDVACNSVDAFQGRQADVCIYSVVRSNIRNDLGFLREPPRLNVALSRGKSALLIVGDQMFCRSARGKNPFKGVIEYIEQHTDDCAMEILQ